MSIPQKKNETHKKTRLLHLGVACLALLFFSGCTAMIQGYAKGYVISSMQKEPIYENFYIHPNAKVGDKARHASEDPNMKGNSHLYSIVDWSDNLFEVVIEPENKSTLPYQQHLWVSRDGKVKKAELWYNGDRFPLRVEGVTKNGHFRSVKRETLATPQTLEINGRTCRVEYIETREISYHNADVLAGSYEADTNVIYFIDPGVPFGLVKTLMTGKVSQHPDAAKFLEFLLKAANPDIYSKQNVLSDLYALTKTEKINWNLEFSYQPE